MSAIDKLRAETEATERRGAALRKLLEAAEELGETGLADVIHLFAPNGSGNGNGNAAPALAPPVDEPRGRDAVRVIVSARPGIWTFQEILALMKRHDWWVSDKAVETAIARLCKPRNGAKPEGRRIGKGRYVFPADWNGEGGGAYESGGSGVIVVTPDASD